MMPFPKTIKKCLIIGAFPIAIFASEAVTWWWTNPPAPVEGREVLDYSFPYSSPNARSEEFPPNIIKTLNCSGAIKGTITTEGPERISVSFIKWDNIQDKGLNQALGHPPEVCMGSVGNGLEAYFPERRATVDDTELVFDVTQFSGGEGEPLYIFKLYWAEGIDGVNLLRNGPISPERRKFKLRSAWKRSFPKHARVLMLGVYGTDGEEEAWELIQEKILGDLSIVRLKE